MNSDVVIKVQNLTKIFKLYDRPKHRLLESLHPLRKKYHREHVALDNLSFEIRRGESVGILGKNGAGKSTLLKILTGVLTPTSGEVQIHGKIAALLELGAGFNPDLSGYDNIFFQGAILGYNQEEMQSKIREIIDFADIGRFIYQPVKTYSSGMFARLAFSIAINVDPDILIVDEALAVGDIFFQSKCYERIRRFLTKDKVVIFVAHDYEAVRTLTKRGFLLNNGKLLVDGDSKDVIFQYRAIEHQTDRIDEVNAQVNSAVKQFGDFDCVVTRISTAKSDNSPSSIFYPGDCLKITVECEVLKEISHLCVGLRIRNREGIKVYSGGTLNVDVARGNHDLWERKFKPRDRFTVEFSSECNFAASLYEIQAYIVEENIPFYEAQRIVYWRDEACFFEVKHNKDEIFFGGIFNIAPEYFIITESK